MIAKARKINISETTEKVLKSIIGEIDPIARKKELEDELTVLRTSLEDKQSGPLALEIKALRTAFFGREGFPSTANENWMKMRIVDFPRIRARFTLEEAIDLARGAE